MAFILLLSAALLFVVTIRSTPSKVLPAAFADERPAVLVESGPYRFVRHPFYTSYILYWIGIAFAAPHIAVVIGVGAILSAYAAVARREERGLLTGPLGEQYSQYMRGTGRFFPRLWTRSADLPEARARQG